MAASQGQLGHSGPCGWLSHQDFTSYHALIACHDAAGQPPNQLPVTHTHDHPLATGAAHTTATHVPQVLLAP